MNKTLYQDDSYKKEWETTINSANGKFIILEDNYFYPNGGGQPFDEGEIICNNETYKVIYAGKFNGNISLEVDKEGLKTGDKVTCKLNWERRYKLMRLHTAAHLLSAIFHEKTGALITGNQLDIDKSRIDFSTEEFDKEKIISYINYANELIQSDAEIKMYYKNRSEALKDPSLVKLSNACPPNVENLRIIEIVGIDSQADGGTHVKNLKEIGKIVFLNAKNKGKSNRRVYYSLE